MPRIDATIITIAALTSKPCLDAIGLTNSAIILMSFALIQTFSNLIISTREPSALIGRIADIIETTCLIFVLPAAVLASGLFDAIRQVAS